METSESGAGLYTKGFPPKIKEWEQGSIRGELFFNFIKRISNVVVR